MPREDHRRRARHGPAARARGSGNGDHMLAVGTISPRKGYGVLVEALSGLPASDGTSQSLARLIVRRTRRPPSPRSSRPRALTAGSKSRACLTMPHWRRRSTAPTSSSCLRFRGLRHGAGRSDGPWPPNRLHDWRRRRPDRTGQSCLESAARRLSRLARGNPRVLADAELRAAFPRRRGRPASLCHVGTRPRIVSPPFSDRS